MSAPRESALAEKEIRDKGIYMRLSMRRRRQKLGLAVKGGSQYITLIKWCWGCRVFFVGTAFCKDDRVLGACFSGSGGFFLLDFRSLNRLFAFQSGWLCQ